MPGGWASGVATAWADAGGGRGAQGAAGAQDGATSTPSLRAPHHGSALPPVRVRSRARAMRRTAARGKRRPGGDRRWTRPRALSRYLRKVRPLARARGRRPPSPRLRIRPRSAAANASRILDRDAGLPRTGSGDSTRRRPGDRTPFPAGVRWQGPAGVRAPARAGKVHKAADLSGRGPGDRHRRDRCCRLQRDRGRDALGCPSPGRGERSGSAAGALTDPTEDAVEQAGRRRGRQRRQPGEVALTCGDRALEVPAFLAIAQMSADVSPADDPPVPVGDRSPHFRAGDLTPRAHLLQAQPGLVDGLAGHRRGGSERGSDLLEAHSPQLAHHHGAPLPFRQLAEIVDQAAQPDAALDGLLDAQSGAGRLVAERIGRPPAADHLDRLVVGDPVEPRSKPDLPGLPGQRRQHLDHRRLERVLGLLGVSEDRLTVAKEVLVVAPVDRREGAPVALLGQPGEPLIGNQVRVPRQRPGGVES